MIYFEVLSKMNKKIRTTKDYWEFIINTKHPIMKGKEEIVKETLKNPDQINRSKQDKSVYLYYKVSDFIICVVCRHENGNGFIITTYKTDKIKEGDLIWKK